MAVSLYRKYRPARFEEIIGQEHVARTLVNAIKQDRVSHAYLFTGPRGTGKTSTAKILAMALNCEAGQGAATPIPDGTCPHCKAIRHGSSMDVVEMDAASNRGIDDIRDLRDKVHFAPVEGRMKVYIVDEVHMLTPEAFNALLKTLEEPPSHAVFVLATTEPHKVPATIVSRCQRFDFRRPAVMEVVGVLTDVAAKEGIEIAESSLVVIARAAAGSFRDALGILDQLATYTGGNIGLQQTLDILGIVEHDLLFEMVDLVHECDTRGALLFVERLGQAGTDYAQFMRDLLGHLRDLYVVRHTAETPASIAATEEQLDRLRSQATKSVTARVIDFIDLLGEGLRSIRQGSDARLELELSLIKLTSVDRPVSLPPAGAGEALASEKPPTPTQGQRPENRPAPAHGQMPETRSDRGPRTDRRPSDAAKAAVVSPAKAKGSASEKASAEAGRPAATQPVEMAEENAAADETAKPGQRPAAEEPASGEAPLFEAARPSLEERPEADASATAEGTTATEAPEEAASGRVRADIDHLRRAWPVVLEAVKKRRASLGVVLGEGVPVSLDQSELVVEFPTGYGFQADQVRRGDNPAVIGEALREVTGKDLRITTKVSADAADREDTREEGARILSKDELIRVLKQEFDARLFDDGPVR